MASEHFKYDVRVSDRFVKSGATTEAELAGRLEALPDLTDACENLEIAQPALGASEGTTEVPVTGRVGAEAASDDDLVAS
ncbi:MAG: hypothetical protein H6717_14295 [Polyangiaceae bacterium]|nr:hypothetical protein [Polyangiaceae bacterium]